MYLTKTIAIALVLSGLVSAHAQDFSERIPVRTFTEHDGLPGESVTAVTQTSDGRLWVGTSGGLTYFDGFRFHVVELPDAPPHFGITGLFTGPEDVLWIASLEGTWRMGPGSALERVDGLGTAAITAVQDLPGGTLILSYEEAWMVDHEGGRLQRISYGYDALTPAHARLSGGEAGTGPAMAVESDDRILILDGVLGPGVFDPAGATTFGMGNQGHWSGMASGADGSLWALDYRRGLFRIEDDLGTALVFPTEQGMTLTIEGNVAHIGTRTEVIRYDISVGRPLESFNPALGVPTATVNYIFVDREGSFWIATNLRLIQVSRPSFRHQYALDAELLLSIGLAGSGPVDELWATSWLGGLLRLAPDPQLVQPRGSTEWTDIHVSRDGRLYATSWDGLFRLEEGAWRLVRTMPGTVRTALGPDDVYVWKDDGVYRYPISGGPATRLYAWPISERDYQAITTTNAGDLLIRSYDYVLRVRTGAVRIDTLAHIPGAGRSRRNAMLVDPHDAIWIGMWNDGLIRVANGSVERLLPGETVGQISTSGDSLVFASTRRGLFALDARTADVVFHLNADDGLLSSNTSGAVIHDGTLYVAHTTGITTMPAGEIQNFLREPPQILVAPIGTWSRHSVSVPELPRNASFSFYATSYLNPAAIAYEYRVSGSDWVLAEGTQLTLHRLRGGAHTLDVRARYRGALPGPETSYAFVVPKLFYETGWFRILGILGIALIIVTGYGARVQASRRREKELRRLVEDRTRRLAEAMQIMRRQAEQLREQDVLKTRFFTNVSHEFRTPLTVIRGVLEDLGNGRHGSLESAVRGNVQIARDNAGRLAHLVEELLDLAQLEAGKVELDLRLGDLVGAISRSTLAHGPAAERRGVQLVFHADVSTYPALFDQPAIDKIVSNLISNAIRHTDEGGGIHVLVSLPEKEGGIELTVRDNGAGIESELLPHIFDRFVSGHEQDGSSGIGLALVSELVELHGGTIDVTSEEGRGSSFRVRLPFDRHISRVDEEANMFEPEFALRPLDVVLAVATNTSTPDATILIVDDNRDIRSYLAGHLAETYEVIEAPGGAEALELARQHRPDLILSDIMMPGMDGEELCRAVRADENLADTPVLFVTARAGSSGTIAGLNAGADGYVEKPFDMGILKARVKRLVESRRLAQQRITGRVLIEALDVTIDSADEVFITRLLEVVDEHHADPLFDVEQFAAEVGLSARQLRRRMQETTGVSPSELIRRYRLERAARMLAAGSGMVAEVSYAVGYSKPAAFATQFKKRFGVNPSEYC